MKRIIGAVLFDQENHEGGFKKSECCVFSGVHQEERLIQGKNGLPDVLKWYHSDWKQLAYCFVHKLFRQIVEWK